jgi:NAD(P)-dependent dehydrogenase (short-subunit alcohol dehydrogenase family)
MEVLRVNTFAPLKLTELLIDNVAASAQRKVGVISSSMGSIADNSYGGAYLYRSSKAALNAVARSMALDLAARGVTVVALSPGWVRTDMGGRKAPLAVADAVQGLRKVLDSLTPADSGTFIDYDGTRLPW